MQNIIDLLMNNPLYILGGVLLVIIIIFYLIKKVVKIAMLIAAIFVAYGAFLYLTEDDPLKSFQDKMETGKSAIDKLDDATKDARDEAMDKIIDEMEKKLKEAAKKK